MANRPANRAAKLFTALAAVILFGTGGVSFGDNAISQKNGSAATREPPQQLLSEVVKNEINCEEQDNALWQFRRTTRNNRETSVYEVVETPQGDLQRLVLLNGQPISEVQAQKEESRIEHLVSDPTDLQKHAQDKTKDEEEEQRLLQMLPKAFFYRYAGEQGNQIKFAFRPNPSFHPQHREGEVFHHMDGVIWVDSAQKRLVRIQGRLATEVKFGGGLLGHLAPGGTFLVEQKNISDKYWELTRLQVNMNGKALFFKTIDVHQNQQDSDFKTVPQNISLEQAAAMLKLPSHAPQQ